jgi:DNA-binding SARP family transcriptional activator
MKVVGVSRSTFYGWYAPGKLVKSDQMDARWRFGVLGPVQVLADGQTVQIGPPMQRALLAALLLRANHTVPVDELVDLLWGEQPPRTARKNIQVYVWRLRGLLGGRLESSRPGYQLSVSPGELDLPFFEAQVASARAASQAGLAEQAAAGYRSALSLWRGAALADVDGIGRLGASAARLGQLRLLAHEEHIDAELALDRYSVALPLLNELVSGYPLHERFAEQQVLALYRAGRRGEAVEAYLRCRRILATELGLEPGPVLQRLAELAREPAPAANPGSESLRELPHTVSSFVGRAGDLAQLTSALTGAGEMTPVWVVTGPAGVGKSTLAVRAAHQLAGSFPDGQLYADLHGAAAGRAPDEPIAVLARFLRALGVTERAIPASLDEASARWRSMLAGRRLLIVLDNAQDAGQVRPLLPAGAGCAVLITSRRSLADIDGAGHLDLGPLPGPDALELLTKLGGSARVSAAPEAAAELLQWLGGLPLAIRIAGARLAARPNWSLASLAARLHDERHRLRELRLGDIAVRTSFLVSYEHLAEPDAKRLFRLLGAIDGPQITPMVATALLDVAEPDAQAALDELVDARLLDEMPGNRYLMHDLIRLFAHELAGQEQPGDRGDALGRVLSEYLARTRHALSLLRPGTRVAPVTRQLFTGNAQALQWLEAERANLVSAVLQATAASDPVIVRYGVELADSLFLFFEMRGHIADWLAVDRAGAEAAQRLGDRTAEARLWHDLAVAHFYLHRMDDAARHLARSLELSRACGDAEGEARALNQAGIMHGVRGDYDSAAMTLTQSLRLREQLGDIRSCAATHGNIAMAHRLAGRHDKAIQFSRSSARLARRGGAPEIEASALGNLGEVHLQLGQHRSALRQLRRALAIRGLPLNERHRGSVLSSLADAYLGDGQPAAAIEHATLAVQAFRQADFRHGEAEALRQLGRILAGQGETEQATDQLRLALTLFTALGSTQAQPTRAELDPLIHPLRQTAPP